MVPTAVAFRDPRHGVVGFGCVPVCGTGAIAVTRDGGRTVRVVLRTRSGVRWVGFAGARLHAALDHGRLLESTDGGKTWYRWRSRYGLGASFADARHGLSVAGPIGGGAGPLHLAWTRDGGRTWRVVRSPCAQAVSDNADVSLVTPTRGWVLCEGQGSAGNQAKAVYRTTDGGRRWRAVAEAIYYPRRRDHGGLGSYGYAVGIAFARDGFGVLWETRGTLFVTRDGGRHWVAKPRLVQPEVDFGESAAALAGGRAFVLLSRGAIHRRLIATRDYGRTWLRRRLRRRP